VREAAHKELERREKEEKVQKEEVGEKKIEEKVEEKGKEKEDKSSDLTNKFIKADEVKTGKPFKMSFAHNTESAPKTKQDFGQKIEPHGKYITNNSGSYKVPGWEYSEIEFKNPLVVEHKNSSSTGWKGDLQKKFGKKGRALSLELKKQGYDGIVTIDSKNNDLSEIVSLTDKDFK